MNRLIVLGTGYAMATKCYNTCFAVQNEKGDTFLTDAGGGNGILVQLERAGIDIASIHEMMVTHEHCDHLLGVVWIVRKIAAMMNAGRYEGEFHIYCHEGLCSAIRTMCGLTLQKKLTKHFDERILLHEIADGQTAQLRVGEITFFDIHSTKARQFGYHLCWDEKKLTCLGDEPYNPLCEAYLCNTDWLLAEAFCLYEQRERFSPYEKHHSTVKEACELAQELSVPHLVLWHTEDENYENRQALYTAEGKQYYRGDLHVPNDLDVLELT